MAIQIHTRCQGGEWENSAGNSSSLTARERARQLSLQLAQRIISSLILAAGRPVQSSFGPAARRRDAGRRSHGDRRDGGQKL